MSELSYWQRWRQAHPDYRAREAARAARRRQSGRRGDRTIEYRNRSARLAAARSMETIPGLHTGHPLFERARQLVRDVAPMAVFKSRSELNREDARSEAVVALLEERDPAVAAVAFLRAEARWDRLTAPLLEGVA